MTILVNWPETAVIEAGLIVLVGGTWLLRGSHAVLRTCAAVGTGNILFGMAAGRPLAVAGGAVILAVAGWNLLDIPGRLARRGKRGC